MATGHEEERGNVSESRQTRPIAILGLLSWLPIVTACDPILNIDGAFFPAWMLCLIVGIVSTFGAQFAFVRLEIDEYIGPPVLIYPCLVLLFTLGTWLIFFRT